MQIDHPEWLLGALCSIKNTVTFEEFEEIIIKVSHRRIERGSKSVEMNLYMLTTLKLIEAREGRYFRTPLGDRLCAVRAEPSRREKYERFLRSVIMRNDTVGPFFRRFLSIIRTRLKGRNPISLTEIKTLFKGETARTLYSLSKEAGLITERRELLRPCSAPGGALTDFHRFRRELERTYHAFARKQTTGLSPRTIYVEIGRLRDIVLSVFGSTEPSDKEIFDELLRKLLDSPEGRNIHIYGAAPQYLPERNDPTFEERVFRYKGKIYVFMSIS